MITFHPTLIQIVTLLVAVVLPLITAYLTGLKTHEGIKAVVLAVLSAATGFGSAWLSASQTHTAFNVGTAGFAAFAVLITAISTHFGIWKPTTLAGILQSVGPTLFESSSDGTPSVTSVRATAPAEVPTSPELVLPAGSVVAAGSDPVTVAPSTTA